MSIHIKFCRKDHPVKCPQIYYFVAETHPEQLKRIVGRAQAPRSSVQFPVSSFHYAGCTLFHSVAPWLCPFHTHTHFRTLAHYDGFRLCSSPTSSGSFSDASLWHQRSRRRRRRQPLHGFGRPRCLGGGNGERICCSNTPLSTVL